MIDSPQTCPRPRILAVDDQRDSLRLLQFRLEAAGMECIPCGTGERALKILEEERVDLVILDIMMPEMDGLEICRRIKANERTRDLPVIFLTAKFGMDDKVRGLEAGGHDYLSKPVQQQELLARTRAALRIKQLQDQLKAQLQLERRIHELNQEKLGEHWQKTLGQLAASLAHEINNPLMVAIGNVQLLRMEHELCADAEERLRVVDESLQRAGQKMRSLLMIAHANEPVMATVLAPLIEDVLTLVNYQLMIENIDLRKELQTNSFCEASPSQLARAVLYLVNNAIEAVRGLPNPAIWISLRREGDWQELRIADNGRGVQQEMRQSIFQPFTTTKGPAHCGIGLFLANDMIESMGGTVSLQDEPSVGTTEFLVRLPLWCKKAQEPGRDWRSAGADAASL